MHCINIILIRKSELRNSKISSIVGTDKLPNLDVPYLSLPQNIMAFPTISTSEVCKYFGDGVTFLFISTDYFGGSGDQSATICETTVKGYKRVKSTDSINEALSIYGVNKIGSKDEFDTIHLGRYRTNDEFLKEIRDLTLIENIVKNTKSF